MALTMTGWGLAALAAVELAFGLAWSREGLGPLRRWRFWIFIGAAVALGPWLGRRTGLTEGDVGLSWFGLALGLEMAGRALTLMLAFSVGLTGLSLSDLVGIFDRLRLRGLGFALGVAMNLLRTLQEMARVTFETIRLRGGLRRPVVALRLFLVTLVSNTLRYGDQIVHAASVRAFDPQRGRGRRLAYQGADLWLAGALVLCSVGWALLRS
jgi:energy-coupling factor transporter transmembrane protein EcfT